MAARALLLLTLLAIAVRTHCQSVDCDAIYDFSFVNEDLDSIFGAEGFLGWGFDASYRDPFFALKPPIFRFSYDNPPYNRTKEYRYPIDITSYAVPDQTFVRTVAKTTTYSYSFRSTEEKRMQLDLRLGLKASVSQVNLELDLTLEYANEEENSKSIALNFVETSLYQLYLGERCLRPEILSAMSELKTTYKLDPIPYELFLRRFGTHFVDSVVVGGSVMQQTIIEAQSSEERLLLNVALKLKFESATGKKSGQPQGGTQSNPAGNQTSSANNDQGSQAADEQTGGLASGGGAAGGGTNIDLDVNFAFTDITQKLQTETISNSEIYGGDPEYTDFVLTAGDPVATKQLFESWKATLLTNPIGIRYRLVEIWELFEDDKQQKEVCTAMATLLGFLPDEDPEYCSSTGRLLGGTIRGGLGATGGFIG